MRTLLRLLLLLLQVSCTRVRQHITVQASQRRLDAATWPSLTKIRYSNVWLAIDVRCNAQSVVFLSWTRIQLPLPIIVAYYAKFQLCNVQSTPLASVLLLAHFCHDFLSTEMTWDATEGMQPWVPKVVLTCHGVFHRPKISLCSWSVVFVKPKLQTFLQKNDALFCFRRRVFQSFLF